MSSKRSYSSSLGPTQSLSPYKAPRARYTRRFRSGALALVASKKNRTRPPLTNGVSLQSVPFFNFGPVQARTFPARMVTTLCYNKNTTMDYKSIVMTQTFYNLNDPNDVNGGGEQPFYYDTLCGSNGTSAPYSRYRVLYSKFTVEFNNAAQDTNPPICGVVVGLGLDSVPETAAGLELLMQRQGAKFVPLGCKSGSNAQRAIRGFVSHKDMLGVKDMKDAADQAAAYNGDPTGPAINLMVVAAPTDFSDATTRTVFVRIRIEMTVEFMDVNTVAQS